MSLFKCQEWWSVNLGENEMFDANSLLVSHIGAEKYQFIILGSHDGLLRFYNPSSEVSDEGFGTGYDPSDLLLELRLQAPILQLGTGLFLSGSQERLLAVLHPRCLIIFTVRKRNAGNNMETLLTLEQAYQHTLRHSAHSFVTGAFGGVQRREFTCIQSLDGLLSFYEQESVTFSIYLPDFLIPCPFAYLPRIDAFLFLNSSMILDCYTYETLASLGNPKKMSKLWSHNIGEFVLGMSTAVTDSFNILVLTERNFYNLNESGRIVFMKRLEFKPVAFHSYVTAESKKLMTIICTDSQFANIYENTCLKWSSRLDGVPVCLNRVVLEQLSGGLVLLSEDGFLQVVYLGTQPALYLVPPLLQPEPNLHEVENILKQLQSEAQYEALLPTPSDNLTLRLQSGPPLCLLLTPASPLDQLQAQCLLCPPLKATPVSQSHAGVCGEVEMLWGVEGVGVVSSLDVKVVVSYVTTQGVLRVMQCSGVLPLQQVLVPDFPMKQTLHKLTLITNKPVVVLSQMFPEFPLEDVGQGNVVAFRYLSTNVVVTIVAAQTSQRYRLQADSMSAMTLVLSLLIERLQKHFYKVPDFNLSYSGALPLQQYCEKIEEYHELQTLRRTTQNTLAKRTLQHRTIQKKVLVNLRDATPKPVSSLHSILHDTHNMVLSSIMELEELESRLALAHSELLSLGKLNMSLLQIMTLTASDMKRLAILFQITNDSLDQGCLEVQNATATFLLQTSLAKNSKDQQRDTPTLEPMNDVMQLKKNLLSVMDAVTKGRALEERSEFDSDREHLATLPALREWDETNEELLPVSSKLVDLDHVNVVTAPPAAPLPKRDRTKRGVLAQILMESPEEEENLIIPEIKEVEKDEEEKEKMEGTKELTEETNKSNESVEGGEELTNKAVEMKVEPEPEPEPEDESIWDIRLDEMRI